MNCKDLGTPASHTCPACAHWPILVWAQGEDTGTLCPKCGWKKRDLRALHAPYTCGCGRAMGHLWWLETDRPRKTICFECAGKRRARGIRPNALVDVRYNVWCEGRCGNLQAWLDLPETKPLTHQDRRYYCSTCAARPSPAPQEIFRIRRMLV